MTKKVETANKLQALRYSEQNNLANTQLTCRRYDTVINAIVQMTQHKVLTTYHTSHTILTQAPMQPDKNIVTVAAWHGVSFGVR